MVNNVNNHYATGKGCYYKIPNMKRRIINIIVLLLIIIGTIGLLGGTLPTQTHAERQITITFWQSLAYPYVSGPLTNLISQFEKEHPGIHVNLVNTGGYDPTYISVLNLDKLPRDQWPDVALIYDIGLGGMIMDKNIIPLSRFMNIDRNQFVQSAISYYTVWGVTYGLPFNTSVPVLYVNTTLAKEYSISKIPTTLRDLDNMCQKTGTIPIALITMPLHSWIVEELLAVEGVPLLNHNNGRTKPGTKLSRDATFALERAFSYLGYLKDKGCLLITQPKSWEEANQNFFTGKAIMLITSSSDKRYIIDNMTSQGYKVSVYPMIGITTNTHTSIIGGAALYVIKKNYSPEKKRAIRELLTFLTSYKAQKEYTTYTGYLPVNARALRETYENASPNMKEILNIFVSSGSTIASKGAVSPALYKIRFSIENALMKIGREEPHKLIEKLSKDVVFHIGNTEAVLYKPHVLLIASLSLLVLLFAYVSYLLLLNRFDEYRTAMIWSSLPLIIAILLATNRNPLAFGLGIAMLSIFVVYAILLLLREEKKVIWSPIPLTLLFITTGYYLALSYKFYGLAIPPRIYIYAFILLSIPILLTLSIAQGNIPFLLASLSASVVPISFYVIYTTKVEVAYVSTFLASLFLIFGFYLAEKGRKSEGDLFKTTYLRIGVGTALLIVIVISVIPASLYWKNTYDVASTINEQTLALVLDETSIDKELSALWKVALGHETIIGFDYLPDRNIVVIKGKRSRAEINALDLSSFIKGESNFRTLAIYDSRGNFVAGDFHTFSEGNIIVRPLLSTFSKLLIVGSINTSGIKSFVTRHFIQTTLLGFYPLILIFLLLLIIFYRSNKKINTILWEEIEAKTSQILAMEDNLKEAYSQLQKEHELLMILIRSITKKKIGESYIQQLLEIGNLLMESSDEINGFFIYNERDGSLIQNEVSVNVKEILKNYGEKDQSAMIETKEGYFIVTRLSTGHILGVALSKNGAFSATILDVLDAFSSLLDTFISLEILRKKTEEMHTHILMALVGALDLKDPYTKGHSLHVAEAALDIGKALQLSEKDLSTLYMASILHDIGKISIPDTILTKPGKLTKEEYEIIKTHPVQGYRLLRNIEGMEEIAEIILYHHERCDGKGYPDGLTCDEIPMLSKIIAVVDAFDAMVNRRVYRKALSLEQAKEEIKKNLGTQFDPYIGAKFLEIADEVYRKIKEE